MKKKKNYKKIKPRKTKYYKQAKYIKSQRLKGIFYPIIGIIMIISFTFLIVKKISDQWMNISFWIISIILVILLIVYLIISSSKSSKKNKTVGDIVLDSFGNEIISSLIDNIT